MKLGWAGVGSFRLALLMVAFGLADTAAQASVIFSYSGTSTVGTPVSFQANLTRSGNTLTGQLFNNSPTSSLAPSAVLGSFCFDIVGTGNTRPTLTYSTAAGDVYLSSKKSPDALQTATANLKALTANDNTWQFKIMNATSNPFLGFGIGTVGNSSLSLQNFEGNIVGGSDYSIYRNEITTQNLNGKCTTPPSAAGGLLFLAYPTCSKIACGIVA